MTTFLHDIKNAFLISIVFSLLIIAVELLTRKLKPSPELCRKLIHVIGGLVCLSFPYLISYHFIVFILAISMALIFHFGERLNLLTCLNRVSRTSSGSLLYPMAVWMTFYLTGEKPWLYISSLLVLAIADAGAALIGSKYGKFHYKIDYEEKSIEGSLIFFLLAFIVIEVPLVLLSPLSPLNSVLSAFLVATIVTGIEAISRNGRDNLFVPLVVCIVLEKITSKPISEILYQITSAFSLSLIIGYLLFRSNIINTGASITLILFTYAAWSLGSEIWALPIILIYIIPIVCVSRTKLIECLIANDIIKSLLPSFMILIIANLSNLDFWFIPYLLTLILSGFYFLHRLNLKSGLL